jgi:phage-related protein
LSRYRLASSPNVKAKKHRIKHPWRRLAASGRRGSCCDTQRALDLIQKRTIFGTHNTVTYVGKLPRDVVFFATDTGNQPTREWLRGLSAEERAIIGEDVFVVQKLEVWKEPLVKYLGDGLWEVRSTLPKGIARIIFSICDGEMIVVNGFIKKSQKTPDDELELALKRKRIYERSKKSTQRKRT